MIGFSIILICGLAVIVMLVVAVGIYFYGNMQNKNATNNSSGDSDPSPIFSWGDSSSNDDNGFGDGDSGGDSGGDGGGE